MPRTAHTNVKTYIIVFIENISAINPTSIGPKTSPPNASKFISPNTFWEFLGSSLDPKPSKIGK